MGMRESDGPGGFYAIYFGNKTGSSSLGKGSLVELGIA